jgi:hypothetical protein
VAAPARAPTTYVAATGRPYPLRIDVRSDSPKADATVGFSAFDKPVPTATPPAETLDISALLSRSRQPL